ncbi:Tetratricopeptide repeat [endosymbiont of Ridgeia piscesae]|jgi:tetratricopeptide (TPR) repeat protein|uniref:Tetratricopeptide repeat n=1 Tax=endosymbiont of Ridgeia piscesae TaxID=54398 RepID=A0A0T5Z096_9GAMM|nr:tetratricopeptide repeat protein [endosymbiont of Ridgeia piscesae]KRT55902.1 Tetratricopeptide repeat [endosymbiont of Ridgeia piscesae]
MKKSNTWTALIMTAALSGCASLPPELKLPQLGEPEPKKVEKPLKTANQLLKKGELGEAVALLEKAIMAGEKDKAVVRLHNKLSAIQTRREEQLEDQLLLQQYDALQKQLPLMAKLAENRPRDAHLHSKLLDAQSEQEQQHLYLTRCGWREWRHQPKLATRCLTVALSIKEDEDDRRLLKLLNSRSSKAVKQARKIKKSQRAAISKKASANKFKQAQVLFEKNELSKAKMLLQKLLQKEPKNSAVRELLQLVQKELQIHLENLFKTGDQLYSQGEVAGAIAVWEAAQKLDPNDDRVVKKIERAQRILDNLEQLRKSR